MNTRFLGMIGGAFLSMLIQVCGADTPKLISREAITSRTHSTWEGSYTFVEDKVLSIEGLPDLHVLLYQRPGHEGTLIDFAEATSDDKLRLLLEADTNVKGVTPALEGIDVLAGTNEAEIVVRWRNPGQGGGRSVEKYRYSPSRIQLIANSYWVSEGRKMKWVKAGSLLHSTPAKYSPRPATPPAE